MSTYTKKYEYLKSIGVCQLTNIKFVDNALHIITKSVTGAHSNAKEYWSRDRSAWTSDIAKASYIGPDTEIYKIFVNKYGWE